MTHIPENRLALYAGGELDAPEALSVTRHLENCAECRHKTDEYRGAAEWLKGVAAEPHAGQLYRLRESVLQSVPQTHSRKSSSWITATAASLALVFVAVLLLRPAQKQSAPATAVELPPLPAGRASLGPLILPGRDWHPAVRHAQPRLTLVAKSSENMPVIRVKTSDPNIVILWVVGSGSEQEKTQ